MLRQEASCSAAGREIVLTVLLERRTMDRDVDPAPSEPEQEDLDRALERHTDPHNVGIRVIGDDPRAAYVHLLPRGHRG